MKDIQKIKRNITRIANFIELGSPDVIIKHDIFNLANKYTGGSFKTILYAIKIWWQVSKLNPQYYFIRLEARKQDKFN